MILEDPPTAIFCASDRMAMGCYEALRDLGKRIPTDVSVVGYDDDWMASNLTPTLTTVLLPHEEMGRWAAEYLLSPPAVDAPGERLRPTQLECPLIQRCSIAPFGAGTEGSEAKIVPSRPQPEGRRRIRN